ncbi:MAG: nucleotidyltransferase domain-containing protein [Methanosarcinales archaeon Met12]|nr:MAG: nucleotidyltransferase domain-containing protein [Methanosarcinales archaeon Met12]
MRDDEMEIDKVIDELKRDGIEAIYLFGSMAKGSVKPFSDIDLCVLTEKDISKKVKEEILSNSSKKIDISIFWDLPPTIRFRVLKEGEILYKKDDLTLQRAKVDTLKSYLDVQPMIKRHCSHILGE